MIKAGVGVLLMVFAPGASAQIAVRPALPAVQAGPVVPGLQLAPVGGISNPDLGVPRLDLDLDLSFDLAPVSQVLLPKLPAGTPAAARSQARFEHSRKAFDGQLLKKPAGPAVDVPAAAPALGAPVTLHTAGLRPGAVAAPSRRLPAAPGSSVASKLRFAANRMADWLGWGRLPDWSENRGINAAIRRLSKSPVGGDVYRYVYDNYRDLTIKVDDTPGASYDARSTRENGKPVVYLTESLVDNESTEVLASYLVRELSDLYYEGVPLSAERGYLAYSNQLRTFAELTGSGRRSWGDVRWTWNKDQVVNGTYVFKRLYDSWKQGLMDTKSWGDVRDQDFFRFIRTVDDSNAGRDAKKTLAELYREGRIDYATYEQMRGYFDQIVGTERDWLRSTNRW